MSTVIQDIENDSGFKHSKRQTSLAEFERQFRDANGVEAVMEVWSSVHASAKCGDMKAANLYLNSKFGLQKAADDSKNESEKRNPISNEIKDRLARAIDPQTESEIVSL